MRIKKKDLEKRKIVINTASKSYDKLLNKYATQNFKRSEKKDRYYK